MQGGVRYFGEGRRDADKGLSSQDKTGLGGLARQSLVRVGGFGEAKRVWYRPLYGDERGLRITVHHVSQGQEESRCGAAL